MDSETAVSGLAALAFLAMVLLVVVPYALVSASAVGVYYGVGVLSPLVLPVFLGVGAVALLAGATGRSDPPTVAGVGSLLGVLTVVFTAFWAVSATSVVGGLPVSATFDYHRWAVLAASLVFVLAAGWFSRLALSGPE